MKSKLDYPISIIVSDNSYIIDNQHYSRITFNLLKFLQAVFNMRKYIDSKTIVITWQYVQPSSNEKETLIYYSNHGYTVHPFLLTPLKLEVN